MNRRFAIIPGIAAIILAGWWAHFSGQQPAAEPHSGGTEDSPGHRYPVSTMAIVNDREPLEFEDPAAARWEDFQRHHPTIDPADPDAFHGVMLAERARHPQVMDDDTRREFTGWLAAHEAMARDLVLARAALLGHEVSGTDADGRVFIIAGYRGNSPIYEHGENREAAISTAASFVRRNAAFDATFGSSVDGSGFFACVNDTSRMDAHPEFRNDDDTAWRFTVIRGTTPGGHATHVAGTIAARGLDPRATGMAPAAHIYSMTNTQTGDVYNLGMSWPGEPGKAIVGNSSLGTFSASLNGVYTTTSAGYDQAHFDTPYYLHFYAAGNSGPDDFSLSTSRKDAKNVFAVGSVSDVTRNTQGVRTGGGNIANSSARGPTRDGRVKPDIVANGIGLFSTRLDGGYSSTSGTSMASPNAAGSAILLQDYFSKRFHGDLMRASTLMAVIINTAEDLGQPGPDYRYGWGLMNTLEAARIIKTYADNPSSRVLVEDRLANGASHDLAFTASGNSPVRATLVWTDPAGPPQTTNTSTVRALINDLNLHIAGPEGTQYLPFVMPYTTGTHDTPAYSESLLRANATTGVNFTDNKIQVLIPNPAAGSHTVSISHAGVLAGGGQHFSLAVTGMSSVLPPASPSIASHTPGNPPGAADFWPMEVLGGDFMLGARVLLRRAGHADVAAYAHQITSGRIVARIDPAAVAPGTWQVVVRNPDGVETVAITSYQASIDATPVFAWTGGSDGGATILMASAGYGNWLPALTTANVAAGSASRFQIATRANGGPQAPLGNGSPLALNASARAGALVFDDIAGHFPSHLHIAANTAATSARLWTFEQPDTTIIELTAATTGRVAIGHDRETLGNLGLRLPSGGTSTIHVAHPDATLDLAGLFDATSVTIDGTSYGRGAIHAGSADPSASRARLRKTGSGTLDLRTADSHGNRVAGLTIDGGTVIVGKNPDIAWLPDDVMEDHIVIDGGTLHFDNFSTNSGVTRGVRVGPAGGALHITGHNHALLGVIADVPGTEGVLIKSGPAALRLAADNTHSGGTTVAEGALRYTTAGSLGSGPVILEDGTRLAPWQPGIDLPNPIEIFGSQVTFGGDDQQAVFSGNVNLNGETRNIHLADTTVFAGNLSNGGLVVSADDPSLVLHLAGDGNEPAEATVLGATLVLTGTMATDNCQLGEQATLVLAQSAGFTGLLDATAGSRVEIHTSPGAPAPAIGEAPVVLGGVLAMVAPPEWNPASGDVFHLFAAGRPLQLADSFTWQLPVLDGGLTWDVEAFPTTGSIAITSAYDQWAAAAGLTGADAAPAADPDGDGLPNLYEFLLGFDPLDPASTLKMTVATRDNNLVLVINRVAPLLTFTIETTDDLNGAWHTMEQLTPAPDVGGPVEIPITPAGQRRFYRLRITVDDP